MPLPRPKPITLAPTGEVHPVAALFPMLADDELDELASDIAEHGLVHPIVIDSEGVLIDGRNRLEACRRAGVDPVFVQIGDHEPVSYILSSNVARRHLTQGQRAMAVAKAHSISNIEFGDQQRLARAVGVSAQYVSFAFTVLEYAPDLADVVLSGGSLNDAYAEAFRRKRLPELEQAEIERRVLQEEQRRQSIQLAIEEIGPELPIPESPDLSMTEMATSSRPSDQAIGQDRALEQEQRLLKALVRIKYEMQDLVALEVPLGGDSIEHEVMAVRAAVSQIVTMAYGLVEKHNAALKSGRLRRVI